MRTALISDIHGNLEALNVVFDDIDRQSVDRTICLGDILGYVKKLEELDISDVEPMAHAVPLDNVLRADEVQPSISNDEALANAPKAANGLFVVPKNVE